MIINGYLQRYPWNLCLTKYEDNNVFVSIKCLFSFSHLLIKSESLFKNSNGETRRNKHFSSQKNDNIFFFIRLRFQGYRYKSDIVPLTKCDVTSVLCICKHTTFKACSWKKVQDRKIQIFVLWTENCLV